jgi:tetratricopeptide (TPR) repeat protein
MQLLHIVDRFILYQGVGQHPSQLGCEAMAVDVINAYASNMTGYEYTKAQIEAKMTALLDMLRNTGAGEDIDRIITKIAEIQELMAVIDESGLTADDMRDLLNKKDQLVQAIKDTMALMGLTEEKLIRQAEFIKDHQMLEKMGAALVLMDGVIRKDPELTKQFQTVLEGYANKLLEPLGVSVEQLITQGKFISDSISTEDIAAAIKVAESLATEFPALKAKYESMLKGVLDAMGTDLEGLIRQGALIVDSLDTEKLVETIVRLNDFVKKYPAYKAQVEGYIQQILDALGVTMDELIEQGRIAAGSVSMEEVIETVKTLNELVKKYPAYKAQVEDLVQKTLTALDMSLEDVIRQGQLVIDSIDTEAVVDAIVALNDLIEKYPQYKAQYEAAVQEFLDALGMSADELLAKAKAMASTVDLVEVAKMLKEIEPYLENLPAYTKQAVKTLSTINARIDAIRSLVEQMGIDESNEIVAQIRKLVKEFAEADTPEEYQAIVDRLKPLGERLIEIGVAVSLLPEYEKAVNEFTEASSLLGNRVDVLEKMVAHLTAKSVNSKFSTKVTFANNKAKLTLSIKADADADKYILKLNGKTVKYTVKNGKLTYVINKAKIGKKYKFSLTPVVYYEGTNATRQYDGITTVKTVVPKVSLAQATIKKVKAGEGSATVTWKKVKGASGYKISYKTGKTTKYVNVKSGKLSKTIRKLQSGKKYTIKVRAFKKVNGKKYYGKWSKAKKVRVK